MVGKGVIKGFHSVSLGPSETTRDSEFIRSNTNNSLKSMVLWRSAFTSLCPQGARSMLPFYACISLLMLHLILRIHPASSVPLDFPIRNTDPALETNRVDPATSGEHKRLTSTEEILAPTSYPPLENCTQENSTQKVYNRSEMIDSIRQLFLTKLNLTEPPSEQQFADVQIPPALLSSYYARLQANEHEPQDCPEKEITYYSRSVNLYFPSHYVSTQAVPDHFISYGKE